MEEGCRHEWVYIGIESMRALNERGVWVTDLSNNVIYFEYRVFYCKFCLSLAKIRHKDHYGNDPLERKPED